ncbi:glycosyltransferase family 2 protein [Hyunsoonleella pacifica]|uniref:Glycosyltransferase family 2 protein n=1 Tax=Hyunsoonleella pacifica TaxID=1080224 RepID=A0A4Q9FRF2_9FLAO|nr:glycosyltransferase family 2 protein [Hyunsoonleella pacifica]TBN18648.1 glycosyltransferase family 2 protein [Hyunsoonleella pacifica]GGD03526.1 acetylglucosaminyltransferase [Hyunsoonleella pacifica]
MSKIAVLLTCFNRVNKTLSCLENLFTSIPDNTSLEVYLVDDGSTDGTGASVREQFPRVNVIQGTGSLYWNGGMHLAWKTASKHDKYDYYILLNDDTFLYPDALQEMLESALEEDNNVVVCGAFKSEKTGAFTYGGQTKKGHPIIPNGTIQECHNINGNCLLVPKKVYDLVGNLDPIFPHAIGDFDYGHRALAKGFKLITTKRYLGSCESNDYLPKWCYSHVPFKERLKALYSPLGNSHPKYYFIYTKRHFGLGLALKHLLSIHLRLLIPNLWKQ